MARILHHELARHYGVALADVAGPPLGGLPARLRETLDRLLDGDSEKQAAARLGLSPHTVHEYVKALYRRLGVNSRAELLALFLKHHRRADRPSP